jgi:hypothetical protein
MGSCQLERKQLKMRDRVTFHAGINSFSQSAGNANSLRDPDRSLRPATPDKGDAAVADNRTTCKRVVRGLALLGSKGRSEFHPDLERRFL